ncbi:hypothetical protein M408DRAFT_330748 [Serendipita vermifera MAFF 305830]|uniref:Uncharacterized protein n=1 Tax=Serendipita vermifera MAFF 305830 TaxID=933852 RepID=A0A0C2WIJ8_SERVB|nr:hypothetical protein M408DRAFT_330748 [Serendipita vermifera MAFF 305830]
MGVQAMVKSAIVSMERVNATNVAALEKWSKRATRIAKELVRTGDSSRERELQIGVQNVARLFIEASGTPADNIFTRLEPNVQKRREEILIDGEKLLDSFQPPSTGRLDAVHAAMKEDAEDLASSLEGLSTIGDMAVLEINERVATEDPTYYSVDSLHQLMSSSGILPVGVGGFICFRMVDEMTAEPKILLEVSDMNTASEFDRYEVSFDDTFSDLVDFYTQFDNTAPIPDFWGRRVDPTRNKATESGVWWEWQMPKKRIADAIMENRQPRLHVSKRSTGKQREGKEKGEFELRSVFEEGEYIVALVGSEGKERGAPVCIPRRERQPAAAYIQEAIFPNHTVSKVLHMEDGSDISEVIFDNRNFDHKTNPLYVELGAELDDG